LIRAQGQAALKDAPVQRQGRNMTKTVAVIGAGIVGVATAIWL